jgi:Outer membrane efflux protein
MTSRLFLQVAATLPPPLKQLAQQRDLLTALSGGFPNQNLPETFELASLQLPQELPITLPSQLVEQRPDVRQAEENLHSASALIGVAVANRLPSFSLTADAGSMALVFTKMFSGGSGFWDLGAGVTQPVFGRWHAPAPRASCQGCIHPGRGAISQHRPDRVPECRGYSECTATGRRGPEDCVRRERRCRHNP